MTMYNVAVKGTKHTVEVNSDNISDTLCTYIFQKGLEAVLGRGRTKLGPKDSFPDATAYAKAATEIFMKQVEDLYAGKTRMTGGGGGAKAKGEEAKIKAEMLRLAKKEGDSILRAAGHVVSKVSGETKKQLAEALIAQDPDKFKKAAMVNLAAAAETASNVDFASLGVQITGKKGASTKAAPRKGRAKKEAAPAKAPPPSKGPQRPSIRQ